MKIIAQSIEELILKSGAQKDLLAKLDEIIVNTAPQLKRQLFAGPSITMIGYGEMPWKRSSSEGIWSVRLFDHSLIRSEQSRPTQ